MRQSRVRRGIGLTGFVARLIFSILYSTFIYIPLLVLSYFIATRIYDSYSNDLLITSGLTILICYLLFALIYFLKGLLIGLRNSGRNSWLVLWVLCVVLTCGSQAVLVQSWLENTFASRGIANYELWSLIGAALVGLIIYTLPISHQCRATFCFLELSIWISGIPSSGYYRQKLSASEIDKLFRECANEGVLQKVEQSRTFSSSSPLRIADAAHIS